MIARAATFASAGDAGIALSMRPEHTRCGGISRWEPLTQVTHLAKRLFELRAAQSLATLAERSPAAAALIEETRTRLAGILDDAALAELGACQRGVLGQHPGGLGRMDPRGVNDRPTANLSRRSRTLLL